jgi:hypothetical protein
MALGGLFAATRSTTISSAWTAAFALGIPLDVGASNMT